MTLHPTLTLTGLWMNSGRIQVEKNHKAAHSNTTKVCVCERERRRESLIPIETVRQTLTKRKYFISWSAVCLSVCLSNCHTPCGAEPIGIFLWWHIHWAQRATWHSSLWTLTHRHTHTHIPHTPSTPHPPISLSSLSLQTMKCTHLPHLPVFSSGLVSHSGSTLDCSWAFLDSGSLLGNVLIINHLLMLCYCAYIFIYMCVHLDFK